MHDINKAIEELNVAYSNLDNADRDYIDAAVFRIAYCEARLDALIKTARAEMGMSA